MIHFRELKKGDYVLAESDGQAWQGEVNDLNNDEKQVSINNGVQDFWFDPKDLYPIPVDDKRLSDLNFKKVVNDDGSIKYMKDAFRILIPGADNFLSYTIWYRDEKRYITEPIYLHQLQNHYLEMTKVHLTNSTE